MRSLLALGVVALTIGACARAPASVQTAAGPVMTPAPAPATAASIPTGTVMQVRLTQPLGTAHSRVGDRFTATVDLPIVAQNGETVVPTGSVVAGTVLALNESTAPNQPATIHLGFESISIRGRTHNLSANVLSADVNLDDGDRPSRTVERAAAGAAAGAVLGTILNRDLESAVVGAAIGAGVGTAISLGTSRADANLPLGARLNIQTTQHVQLR